MVNSKNGVTLGGVLRFSPPLKHWSASVFFFACFTPFSELTKDTRPKCVPLDKIQHSYFFGTYSVHLRSLLIKSQPASEADNEADRARHTDTRREGGREGGREGDRELCMFPIRSSLVNVMCLPVFEQSAECTLRVPRCV